MYDVVGNPVDLNENGRAEYPSLVLEWFDTTMQDAAPEKYRHNLVLMHAIVRAVLSSSETFLTENLVNTVHTIGEAYDCQPFAMRAPEVWRGLPCRHQSETWALAAMLLVWMNPRLLGTSGLENYFMLATVWSIAKLMQLFPGWRGPPSDRTY
nr:hypothetical protein CFP56_62883 [Quercus suber]